MSTLILDLANNSLFGDAVLLIITLTSLVTFLFMVSLPSRDALDRSYTWREFMFFLTFGFLFAIGHVHFTSTQFRVIIALLRFGLAITMIFLVITIARWRLSLRNKEEDIASELLTNGPADQ